MTGARTVAVVALVIVASRLPAQQANASPAAFGMGNNATATAQGYDAVKWNPALLALPTNTAFSFSLAAVSAVQGLTPVSFDDVAKFGGRTIDPATKEEWLQRIGPGTQDGHLSAGVSAVGLSMGTLGFQLSATGYGTAKLNQDAAEVLLFGNAGRAGSARTFQFNGSRVDGGAFTTGAASFAMPLKNVNSLTPARLAIGVTGKFILGNGYVRAEDNGSVLTPTNIAVRFPMITNRSGETNVGTGLGLDAGLAWHSGDLSLGLAAQNIINTFQWDTTKLAARYGVANFNGTTTTSDFQEYDYSTAPQSFRDSVAADRFTPTYAFGAALQVMPSLLVAGDIRSHPGTGIAIDPRLHVGVGAEFTGLSFLPLRVGVAAETGAKLATAGIGVRFWHFEVGVSGMYRKLDIGGQHETGVLVNALSFH